MTSIVIAGSATCLLRAKLLPRGAGDEDKGLRGSLHQSAPSRPGAWVRAGGTDVTAHRNRKERIRAEMNRLGCGYTAAAE